MSNAVAVTGWATPRITFSALCEFLHASPVRQIGIVREQKYPNDGPMKNYVSAMHQIVRHAVSGTPFVPNAPNLRPHERELIEKVLENGWQCPSQVARRPSPNQPPLILNGVEISIYPDLLLGEGAVKSGAMKVYCAKTKVIDPQVGLWMASLLYHYRTTVSGDTATHPDLCIVSDVRRNQIYRAGRNYRRLLQNVVGASQIIRGLWPQV
jgi:hypothetical protein